MKNSIIGRRCCFAFRFLKTLVYSLIPATNSASPKVLRLHHRTTSASFAAVALSPSRMMASSRRRAELVDWFRQENQFETYLVLHKNYGEKGKNYSLVIVQCLRKKSCCFRRVGRIGRGKCPMIIVYVTLPPSPLLRNPGQSVSAGSSTASWFSLVTASVVLAPRNLSRLSLTCDKKRSQASHLISYRLLCHFISFQKISLEDMLYLSFPFVSFARKNAFDTQPVLF